VLSEELPSLPTAAAVDISAMDGSLNELSMALKKAKIELDLWCEEAASSNANILKLAIGATAAVPAAPAAAPVSFVARASSMALKMTVRESR
jgi:hypothetical protein